jgi:hypothetical protein
MARSRNNAGARTYSASIHRGRLSVPARTPRSFADAGDPEHENVRAARPTPTSAPTHDHTLVEASRRAIVNVFHRGALSLAACAARAPDSRQTLLIGQQPAGQEARSREAGLPPAPSTHPPCRRRMAAVHHWFPAWPPIQHRRRMLSCGGVDVGGGDETGVGRASSRSIHGSGTRR